MTGVKKFLVVDDNPADVELLRRLLEDLPSIDVEFHAVSSARDAARATAERDYDLVFSDYCLGKESGVDVVNAVRKAGSVAPVIMLTGQGSERAAVEAMRAGVIDYIGKESLDAETILGAVTRALETSALRRRVEEYQKKLEELAHTDSLTGLLNRRAFIEYFDRELRRAERTREPISLLMMDVDNFKRVNDTHGHLAGDRVLVAAAGAITKRLRATDFASRFGGEEFAVILANTRLSGAVTMAERLREEIKALTHSTDAGKSFSVTCSIGVSGCCQGSGGHETAGQEVLEALIREADAALYRAKDSGRDMVVAGCCDEREKAL